MVSCSRIAVCACSVALLISGCLDRTLARLNPCLVSGVSAAVSVNNVDKVDLLFMIDDSSSMQDKQHALRVQMPHLMQVLTSGDRDGDGVQDFPPPKDMHIGVVTSDMGLVGVDGIEQCSGFGDDGIFQHQNHAGAANSADVQGCQASYPTFLSFMAGVNQPDQTARDFACIANVGTGGCGLEQPLESVLKALWPSTDNRVTFLTDASGMDALGHGDTDNLGFLRNDPTQGLSLIAIVLLTDEDDGSISDPSKYLPPTELAANDPLAAEPLNLRQGLNPDSLYPIMRYVNGLKALRPGNENLVIAAAITGVPMDLTDPSAQSKIDFNDPTQRNNFYTTLLADPRMQEVQPPAPPGGVPGPQHVDWTPVCVSSTGAYKAVPGRRVVQFIQGFAENGAVYSICADDYAPAIDGIIAIIATKLGAVCLPRPLVRNAEGLVSCNVIWELPSASKAQSGTPTDCSQAPYLIRPAADQPQANDAGGAICQVAQLAVKDAGNGMGLQAMPTVTGGQMYTAGWYYDDFSSDEKKSCKGESQQRVSFTSTAKPPSGVTVKLECLDERQSLSNSRTDIATNVQQPTVGASCDKAVLNGQTLMGDDACAVRLTHPTAQWKDGVDHSMFCHPELNVCVLGCTTSADCPPAWVCDSKRPDTLKATVRPGHPNGTPICINPTCGDLK